MIVFLAYNLILLIFIIVESTDIYNRVFNILFNALIFSFLAFVLAYSFRLKDVIYDQYNDHHVDVKTVDLDKPLESNEDFYAEKITKFDEEQGVYRGAGLGELGDNGKGVEQGGDNGKGVEEGGDNGKGVEQGGDKGLKNGEEIGVDVKDEEV